MDRRYDRGAEDALEFVARLLDRCAATGISSDLAASLRGTAVTLRGTTPGMVRATMERDDAWMRKVAERDVEHQRQGWRDRTAAYLDRQKRIAAGEQLPPLARGPKRKRNA